ncbi:MULTISPECIES: hypothetical protein [Laspinema]|uniref:hypothetical protein n=1 Tax=Laspinema TaxID=2584823 RepID=UPI0021BBABAB|nr:hypothetical protein [Laspinema sp. D3c]MCT7964576.1 hypothetical protein [Laspinema sp. D2b]MCT7997174.1 hypothetical protein [Laspinema sp. D3c]
MTPEKTIAVDIYFPSEESHFYRVIVGAVGGLFQGAEIGSGITEDKGNILAIFPNQELADKFMQSCQKIEGLTTKAWQFNTEEFEYN